MIVVPMLTWPILTLSIVLILTSVVLSLFVLLPVMIVMLSLMRMLEARGVLDWMVPRVAPALRPFGLTGLGVDVGQHDLAAPRHDHPGGGRPEAGTATRHHKNLVLDFHPVLLVVGALRARALVEHASAIGSEVPGV